MAKLEYVDGVMREIAARDLDPVVPSEDDLPVEAMRYTVAEHYESERDANVRPGESIALGRHVFRLDTIENVKGPNYVAARATVSVTRDGKPVSTLYPERRVYTVQEQVMTEAAIDPGLTGDLYVSLGDPLEGGAWLVKVQHKPFIDWIWGGCLVMALGGLLAASDRRYRFSEKRRTAAQYA